jgi:hypothetical protein
MRPQVLWGACGVSILLAGTAHAIGTWEQVSVPQGQHVVTIGGEDKTIFPGCQFGEPYSFHFKDGKDDKLLIFYNGGGACWDSSTCVESILSPDVDPVYVPSTTIANNPADMGGILDAGNPENPYTDWSMLFISYCTGDVHVGSQVTAYEYPPGSTNFVPINHRGFDNFLYAMDWLKTSHPEIVPKKIFNVGSSAGAYGAALNYPWVYEFYPSADKIFLVGDGGFGVLTYAVEFVDAVFEEPSNWNLHGTLHPILISLPNAVVEQPESLIPETYNLLRAEYPKEKFAQYTTAYDAVQILFWDIMQNPDDPSVWGQGLGDPDVIFGWNYEMNGIDGSLQLSLPDNYRSYIGPGCNHTIFRYNDDFYDSSLTSISFLQWLSAMTGGKEKDKGDWQNLSCTTSSNCGEENLSSEGISACLARSLGE